MGSIDVARQSPTKAPYFYTDREGGTWKDWPKGKYFYYLPWLNLRGGRVIYMEGLRVHSLAFGCVQAGSGHFLRWDCIHGFHFPITDVFW